MLIKLQWERIINGALVGPLHNIANDPFARWWTYRPFLTIYAFGRGYVVWLFGIWKYPQPSPLPTPASADATPEGQP